MVALGLSGYTQDAGEKQGQSQIILAPISELHQEQLELYHDVLAAGLTPTDFLILKAIVRCESGWSQTWPDGTLKVSKGNVGYFQINRFAWLAHFTAESINIDDGHDNFLAGIELYKKDGLAPWQQWSGHCWLPKVAPLLRHA